MVNIISSSFRMGNIDMKKPPLTLRLNAPSYALVCATYEQSSKAEWANRCGTGYKHRFSLSGTRNNKVGITPPRTSCLSHDCEIVCSEGHHILILFMSFAHSKNDSLLLPLVLLKLENDAWRFWRFWAPNPHIDLEHMQVDFQVLGFFEVFFLITLWKSIFLVN